MMQRISIRYSDKLKVDHLILNSGRAACVLRKHSGRRRAIISWRSTSGSSVSRTPSSAPCTPMASSAPRTVSSGSWTASFATGDVNGLLPGLGKNGPLLPLDGAEQVTLQFPGVCQCQALCCYQQQTSLYLLNRNRVFLERNHCTC